MYKIPRSWMKVLIFFVILSWDVYLAWCNFTMDPTAKAHTILKQISEKAWWKCWQWLDKRSRKEAWPVHGCLDGKLQSYRHRKSEAGEKQSQEHNDIFFITRSLFTKNSCWQAKQLISHITVTFYGHCIKVYKDIAPNFGGKRTGCWIKTASPLILPYSPGKF